MKHLLLIFLFSGSLDSFCQDTAGHRIDLKAQGWIVDNTPDTLRAMLLVTMHHGIARVHIGFVVVQPGRKTIYLDCRKRPLKYPAMGWGYEVVDKTDYDANKRGL